MFLKSLFFFLFSLSVFADLEKSKFVIIICSYNNEKYVRENIISALNQTYDNFRVIYVDDGSTDKTLIELNKVLENERKKNLVTIISNPINLGSSLANHYNIIHNLVANDEICVLLDGDDALANSRVLTYLNSIYADNRNNIWLTYGQFKEIQSGNIGFCCEYPKQIRERNLFRQYVHMPSHLKTFYAWLFKKIKKEDLLLDGSFFKMTGDLAIMLPMIEMAKNHYKFIDTVLYHYNDNNQLSDHKKNFEYQMEISRYIRKLPPYSSLD